jgi:hypothetical protein
MEIFPIQPVGVSSLRVKDVSPQADVRMPEVSPKVNTSKESEVFEEALSVFASMTPRRLREIASESFQREEIDADTYRELSTELPLQSVDRNGNILDLSTLTDDSQFDYAEYYRTQQSLAEMIGDMDMAGSYAKVLDFFSKST